VPTVDWSGWRHSLKRVTLYPDIPTIAESVCPVRFDSWRLLAAIQSAARNHHTAHANDRGTHHPESAAHALAGRGTGADHAGSLRQADVRELAQIVHRRRAGIKPQ